MRPAKELGSGSSAPKPSHSLRGLGLPWPREGTREEKIDPFEEGHENLQLTVLPPPKTSL